MERILVTGVAGQLGYDIVKELNSRGIECKGVDIADFDLTKKEEVINAVESYNPTCIIHCAAFTAVDKAEDEYEKAYAVNTTGTSNIAKAASKVGARMVYISTDYVFDGEKEGYHDAYDEKHPLGAYGKTKYLGELECKEYLDKLYIIRLSWVFGINGDNFVRTMLRLSKTKEEISVVSDQRGSPTYTPDASKLICDIALSDKYGEYNVSNEGYCSWYDFACAIFDKAGISICVKPIKTEEYPTKTKRPHNSCFSRKELDENGFNRLPNWQDALSRYIEELRIADLL